MFSRLKLRLKKTGLPPGTLIHVGEQKTDQILISILAYSQDKVQHQAEASVEDCRRFKDRLPVTWINVEGLHQVEILRQLGQIFDLHPLVLEDILNTNQRPKLEAYEDYLYLVLKMLYYEQHNTQLIVEQVSLVVKPNVLISFQEQGEDVFDPVRRRVKEGRGQLRKSSTDYLAYTLLDAIVDSYFIVLEKLGEDIELLEEELIRAPDPDTLEEIYRLKRELIFLHKSVWPLREVISTLTRGETDLFQEATKIYLRDVYDHTIQVIDLIEIYRDLVTGMLDIYLSSVSNKLNNVMKVLTVIATIFIPLTFITSLYGMNFEHMPELGWRWGYPMIWLVMLTISAAMIIYFKKQKWL
jgi:magnesium transporter